MLRMLNRRGVAALGLGLLVLTLPACNKKGGGAAETKSLAPKDALKSGVKGVRDSDKLRIRLSLLAKPDDLVALSDGKLTQDQAQKIVDSFISIETRTTNGKKLSEIKPGDTSSVASEFAVNIGDDKLVEFRSVSNSLFIRVDVNRIAEESGQQAQVAQLRSRAGSLPPNFAFAGKALNGEWLSLDLNALKNLGQQFANRTGATAPPQQQQQQIAEELEALLLKDVTVTRAGADDKGDDLIVTAKLRNVAQDFAQLAARYGGSAAAGRLNLSDVPDRDVKVDVHVKDGGLSEISVDFGQFAEGEAKQKLGNRQLGLRIQFDDDVDEISKPDNATPVDISAIVSGFLGGLGSINSGGFSSGGSAAPYPTR